MKKAFYIIFSFYILALAIIPCGDEENVSLVENTTIQSNHQGHGPDESCTPFCVCSCCSSNIEVNSFQYYHEALAIIQSSYPVQQVSKTTTAIIPIWQPPKLS